MVQQLSLRPATSMKRLTVDWSRMSCDCSPLSHIKPQSRQVICSATTLNQPTVRESWYRGTWHAKASYVKKKTRALSAQCPSRPTNDLTNHRAPFAIWIAANDTSPMFHVRGIRVQLKYYGRARVTYSFWCLLCFALVLSNIRFFLLTDQKHFGHILDLT